MNKSYERAIETGKDPELVRAAQLQAKWNGTTVQEEWEAMHRVTHKKDERFYQEDEKDYGTKQAQHDLNRDERVDKALLKEAANHGALLPNEAQACKYWNQQIRHNPKPCDGNRCGFDCPNVVCRRYV